MKIKINRWIIWRKDWKRNSVPYILDFKDEEVNDDEISMCIQEQIYGDSLK